MAAIEYEAVIGLEVHAQLLTASKIFCGCSTRFGEEPNTHVCPICTGLPGVLPVLNRRVLELAIRTGLALNCRIANASRFARKNYFYPDLPKGYQISQFELPLAEHGTLDIEIGGAARRIGVTRVHMEEDAGKLVHGEKGDRASYVDYNRAGVPLVEIVSEPEIRSPEEAAEYMRRLRDILLYIEVCDGNMAQGSLRCDANVSMRPIGTKELGTKTEVKNMNSFRFVEKALAHEIRRQIEVLSEGGKVVQETRLFDSASGVTHPMRSKEEAHDYRYFPEPDLLPLEIAPVWIDSIRERLPELPQAKKARFVEQYGVSVADASVLVASRAVADFFEEAAELAREPKEVAHWMMRDVLRELKEKDCEIGGLPMTAEKLARMVKLIAAGTINRASARTVFDEVLRSGKDPEAIVREKDLAEVQDSGAVEAAVDEVIAASPKEVEAYRGGKEKLLGFFVGQVMKKMKGKGNPQVVNEIVRKRLGK